eukprot:267259-Rhodomonas_salina.2
MGMSNNSGKRAGNHDATRVPGYPGTHTGTDSRSRIARLMMESYPGITRSPTTSFLAGSAISVHSTFGFQYKSYSGPFVPEVDPKYPGTRVPGVLDCRDGRLYGELGTLNRTTYGYTCSYPGHLPAPVSSVTPRTVLILIVLLVIAGGRRGTNVLLTKQSWTH